MKEKEEDIKDISNILEFFNRTTKALGVFKEQSEGNAYMLICVEDVTVNGEKKELTHVSMGENNDNLILAINQSIKKDKDSKRIFMTAAGMYSMQRLEQILKSKEGEK